jgi:uncharacterized protein (DUF1778 family)
VTRGKKNAKVTKEEVFNVRCTGAQKVLLEEVAAHDGLGLSTWTLHAALLKAEERLAARKEKR